VTAREDSFEELLRLSREHVGRSRGEPGCVSHAVYRDPERPLRLFFFEEWRDRAALDAHFARPESAAFVRAARRLAESAPELRVWEATEG
jgi:quinol monooxygenase YgiN